MIDIDKLTNNIVSRILEEENLSRKKVVVYGGRFQPFHSGHFKTYQHLVDKFGRDSVYIGTSDKVSKPKSPFSFKEKEEIMTKMFNIPKNRIVKVKNPYTPKEILQKVDDDTAFIAVVGKKDANRLGGSYFEEYKNNIPLERYKDKGYVYIAPALSNLSGTEVRDKLGDPSKSDDVKEVDFKRIYGKYDDKIFTLVTSKLTESVVLEWAIKESDTLLEIPKAEIDKIDKYADKQLDPIDIDLSSNHFFQRINDPRNDKEISSAELIGFFKRLKKNKNEFIDFLNKYKQIVATDNRSKINIPFMKKANKAIAKTIMRKNDFKTSNVKLSFEDYDRTSFYEGYIKNVLPEEFKVKSNGNILEIEVPVKEDKVKGGLADNMKLSDIAELHGVSIEKIKNEFKMGVKVEMEHTNNKEVSVEIAKDHLYEDPNYYTKLKTIEPQHELVHLKEAPFIIHKGFRFIASKPYKDIKKGVKYIVDDIIGRIGDLTISLKDERSGKKYEVDARSMAEFYSKVLTVPEMKQIDEKLASIRQTVLTEGGAYGHMNHPFDLEIDLTFGDLKSIVNLALEGKLELAREKTDGQALSVSWRDDRGGLIAARNKSHLKNSGIAAMDLNDLKSKFSGRGALTDAYTYAMKDLEKAIGSLSEKQREEIFQNGSSFMNIEVIFPENPNVIPYGQSLLVFHGTMQYDEDGNAIGENQPAGRKLADMIDKVNQSVQDHYKLQGPPIQKLPKSTDLSKKKPKYLKQINKLQKEFNLKDNDGVGEYHQAWWENWVEKNAPKTLDNLTKMHLVKRWAYFDKSLRLNGKSIGDEEVLEWAKKVDKQKHDKIASENLQKFETIFLSLGAEILSYMSSVLTVNPDDAVRKIKDRLDATIKEIEQSKDEKKIAKLKKELKRLEAAGGVDKLVPAEGIVFVYKGLTLKLTGVFAPINQLLGIMYRG